MRFIISGTAYDVASLSKASLTDLLNLKKFTGMTLADLERGHGQLEASKTGAEALGNTDALMTLAATIWLARWKAGDRLDFEAACDFPLDELQIESDPGEEAKPEEAPDPTEPAPPASVPDADPSPPVRAPSRSRTSKGRSRTGS